MTPERLAELKSQFSLLTIQPCYLDGKDKDTIDLVLELIREVERQALIIKGFEDVAESDWEASRQEWVEKQEPSDDLE